MAQRLAEPPLDGPDADYRHVYASAGWPERLLKLLKEMLWMALLLPGVWMLRRAAQARTVTAAWPALAFGADAAVAAAFSAAQHGPWIALAGARACTFVALAVLGRWLAQRLAPFAQAVAALLALQLALVPLEAVLGLHIFHEWTPLALAARVSGTLVQPNSLGVFAVCGFAFWLCFSPTRARLRWLAAVAVALVLASGSGTGVVCIAAAALAWGVRRASLRLPHAVLAVAAAALLTLFLLPVLTGRDDVLASVFAEGRLRQLQLALSARPWTQVLWGEGLGVRTNLALILEGEVAVPTVPTDSSLIGFLVQLGILGAALFYGLLAWAARRDARARPFYAAVLLCSLTLNLTELFPVNVLLGLALAHSIWAPDSARAARRDG